MPSEDGVWHSGAQANIDGRRHGHAASLAAALIGLVSLPSGPALIGIDARAPAP